MQEDALPLFSIARVLVFLQLQYQIPLLLLPPRGCSDAALQRANFSPRLRLFLLPILQPLLRGKTSRDVPVQRNTFHVSMIIKAVQRNTVHVSMIIKACLDCL